MKIVFQMSSTLSAEEARSAGVSSIEALIRLPAVDFASGVSAVRMASQAKLHQVAAAGARTLIERFGQHSSAYLEEARLLLFEFLAAPPVSDQAVSEAASLFELILLDHNSGVCPMKLPSIKRLHFLSWNLATSLGRDAGDYSQSYQWLRRIVALLPSDESGALAQCWRMASFCARQLGDWTTVLECSMKSLELDDSSPLALLLSFLGSVQTGQPNVAKKLLKRIATNPAIPNVAEVFEECCREAISLSSTHAEYALAAAEALQLSILSFPAALLQRGCLFQLVRQLITVLTASTVDLISRAEKTSQITASLLQILEVGSPSVVSAHTDEIKWIAYSCWNVAVDCSKQLLSIPSASPFAWVLLRDCSAMCSFISSPDAAQLRANSLAESVFIRIRMLATAHDIAHIDLLLPDIRSASALVLQCSPELGAAATELSGRLWLAEIAALIFALDYSSAEALLSFGTFPQSLTAVDLLEAIVSVGSRAKERNVPRYVAVVFLLMERVLQILNETRKVDDYVAAVRAICLMAQPMSATEDCLSLFQRCGELLEFSLYQESIELLRVELRWLVSVSHNNAIEKWQRNEKEAAARWISVALSLRLKMSPIDQVSVDFERVPAAFERINR